MSLDLICDGYSVTSPIPNCSKSLYRGTQADKVPREIKLSALSKRGIGLEIVQRNSRHSERAHASITGGS